MGKRMRYTIYTLAAFLILGLSGIAVRAGGDGLRSSPNKKIEYIDSKTGQQVIIDTNDFYVLDQEMKELRNYVDTFSSLPIDTFFYVRGTQGSENITRYKKINGEYFPCDKNGVVAAGSLAVTVDPATLIEYGKLTESSLSAGNAAYSDRLLYLGSGSDGAESYSQGYVDGQQNVTENLDIQYIYHTHEGDENNAGACYTPHTHVETCGTLVYCTQQHSEWKNVDLPTAYEEIIYTGTCTSCGNDTFTAWNPGTRHCLHCRSCGLDGAYEQSCGKTTDTVESAIITY